MVAPTLDLNGAGPGTSNSISYDEGDAAATVAPQATVTDPDSPDFFGGSLTVAITAGGGLGDELRVIGSFHAEEGSLYYLQARIGSISGGSNGDPLFILFDQVVDEENGAHVTVAVAQALVRSIAFANVSGGTTAGTRTLAFTLNDGDGGTSTPVTADVNVTAVDDPAVARDDDIVTPENAVYTGNLFIDNGNGPDTDPEGQPFFVTAVNGDPNAVGQTITLASGARLTVNANGSFTYDPTGAFQLADDDSGAVNFQESDGFSYTVTGGDTANVGVTVTGEENPGEVLYGDGENNVITGTPYPDVFRVEQGGDDSVFGLNGRDVFYFGAAFTANDNVNGGADADILVLQGNYAGGVTFGTAPGGNLVSIASISLFSGSNALYVPAGNNLYSYNLTMVDGNVAAGRELKINGFGLLPGENMTVNGAAESDGSYLMLAGKGDDTLIGGAQGDIFFFGHDGRFGSGDSVDGGGGYDIVYFRGDYAIDFTGGGPVLALSESEFARLDAAPIIFSTPSAFSGVESITLLSFADTTYAGGGDGEFDYVITLADGMAEGGKLTVNGSRLGANETMVVDGSAEESASLRLFGGAANDTLTGGGGDDVLSGGLGSDALAGNAGADVFRYQTAAESTPEAADTIEGFASGVDKVDLSRIDADPAAAGDQAFRYIGEEAFGGQGAASAGELRVAYNDSLDLWEAQGDLDGDGEADLLIYFSATETLAAGDFLL